jgi:hypothetical protein
MSRLQDQHAPNNRDTVRVNPSRRFLLFLVIVGVGLDWRCAFEWFAGRTPFYSGMVLGRAVLVVLGCAGASLLAVFVTRTRWRDAWLFFSAFSMALYDLLSNHWTAYRR